MIEEFDNIDELEEVVKEDDGLVDVQMWQLRDGIGWDRLTTGALRAIHDELTQRGLGYFPQPLSPHRHDSVRIYKRGTAVGNLVEAVLTPTEAGDQLLRETASGDAAAMVEKIRRLVCE